MDFLRILSVMSLFLSGAFGDSLIITLSDSVKSLLNFQQKPTLLSFLICNPPIEMELYRNLTSNSKQSDNQLFFGGKFKDTPVLDGQEQAFNILDMNCPLQQLISAFKNNHYSIVYSRWLIVDSRNSVGALDEKMLLPLLNSIPISQSTELFYMVEEILELRLKQAYRKFKMDDSVVIEDFGSFLNYDGEKFQNLRHVNTTTIRRRDMEGSHFDVTLVIEDPDSLNHLYDFINMEIDPVTKNGYRLFRAILEYLNVVPRLVVSDSWGQMDPKTKNWTGMFGDLSAGKAELAGTPSIVRSSRLDACDYISYSVETGSKIVFRAPKLSYTSNVFLLPFDRLVWNCAFAVIATVIGMLVWSTWTEWNVLVPAKVLDPSRDMLQPQLSDVVFLVFGSICFQGSPASPRSTAGRILILFCLIFIVFLYVSYTAFIVALLQSPANNIKTISDLLESRMPAGNQDTIYFRFWVQRLNDPIERTFIEKRIMNKDGTDNFLPLVDGVRKIQNGLFAFHMETPVGYRLVAKYFSEHEKCDLREIPFANIRSPEIVTRKHSHFKEIIRIISLRIKENGVQRKLWKEVYESKPKCSQQGNFMPLALMDVRPVIFIFIGGVGLSIMVLIMEILIHKYAERAFRCKRGD